VKLKDNKRPNVDILPSKREKPSGCDAKPSKNEKPSGDNAKPNKNEKPSGGERKPNASARLKDSANGNARGQRDRKLLRNGGSHSVCHLMQAKMTSSEAIGARYNNVILIGW
jgi:hypothetical protein